MLDPGIRTFSYKKGWNCSERKPYLFIFFPALCSATLAFFPQVLRMLLLVYCDRTFASSWFIPPLCIQITCEFKVKKKQHGPTALSKHTCSLCTVKCAFLLCDNFQFSACKHTPTRIFHAHANECEYLWNPHCGFNIVRFYPLNCACAIRRKRNCCNIIVGTNAYKPTALTHPLRVRSQ